MADKPTVLVLDDEPAVRTAMARLLARYGYEAATTATLDEARTLLRSHSIQALILDVRLQEEGTGSPKGSTRWSRSSTILPAARDRTETSPEIAIIARIAATDWQNQ